MSDTPTTPDTEGAITEVKTGQAPVETFSREYGETLRGEAAKYRNEKKTAVEQAQAQKDVEWQAKLDAQLGETNRLGTDLGSAWVELQKLYSAIDESVPSDKLRSFAGVIQGSDAESIAASAKSAKELFGGVNTSQPAVDPTQGSGGGSIPLNGDPILAALKKAVGA